MFIFFKLNCDRPAVHDGGMVFSILLLAEFDERLFSGQTPSLRSSSTAPAIWRGQLRSFAAGGLGERLCLSSFSFLFQCLRTAHGMLFLVSKGSILIFRGIARSILECLSELDWVYPPINTIVSLWTVGGL